MMIEAVDPLQGGELDGSQIRPRPAIADHVGFEQPDRRLREGIVVGLPEAARRRLEAGLTEASMNYYPRKTKPVLR